MYFLKYSNKFKKDIKCCAKRTDFKPNALEIVLNKIMENRPLEEKYQNHKLIGEFKDCFECHIKSDLLYDAALLSASPHKMKIVFVKD